MSCAPGRPRYPHVQSILAACTRQESRPNQNKTDSFGQNGNPTGLVLALGRGFRAWRIEWVMNGIGCLGKIQTGLEVGLIIFAGKGTHSTGSGRIPPFHRGVQRSQVQEENKVKVRPPARSCARDHGPNRSQTQSYPEESHGLREKGANRS